MNDYKGYANHFNRLEKAFRNQPVRYIAPHRRLLLRHLLAYQMIFAVLLLFSFQLVLFITIPLLAFWGMYYQVFCTFWSKQGYSRFWVIAPIVFHALCILIFGHRIREFLFSIFTKLLL